jgi:hypothetical protein
MDINNVMNYLVQKSGGMSLSEIVQFCTDYGVDMSTVTVTAVGGAVEAPKRRGRKPGRKPGKAKAAKAVKSGKKKVPPRVKAKANGKDHEAAKKASKKEKEKELDPKAVLAAIKELKDENGWVKAETIKAKLGVDAAALRTVLNALIEEDKVKYTGKARGTQYGIA